MSDEIVIFKKSDLKSVLSETIQSELSNLKALVKQLIVKKDLPNFIQGDKKAGEILGISAKAMQKRRNSGVYREGVDFEKKSGRILYHTDALLNLKE